MSRFSELPDLLALPYNLILEQSTPERVVYRYNWKRLYRPKRQDLWFDYRPNGSSPDPLIEQKIRQSIPGEYPNEYYILPNDFFCNQPKYAHIDHWLKHKDIISSYIDCPCRFEPVNELDIALIPQPPLPDIIPLDRNLLANREIIIGHSILTNQPYSVPFDKFSHLLVVGTTGYGKSTFLNVLMQNLLINLKRIDTIYMLDLKGGVELGRYRHLSDKIHLIREYDPIPNLIIELNNLVEHRLNQMFESGQTNWPEGKIFLIIDEYGEIQLQRPSDSAGKKQHDRLLADLIRLAARGRAAGITIIAQTQSPTDAMIGSRVKAQLANKISFKLESNREAQLVFNSTQDLPADVSKLKHGEFVFFDGSSNETVHLQGYMIVDQSILS